MFFVFFHIFCVFGYIAVCLKQNARFVIWLEAFMATSARSNETRRTFFYLFFPNSKTCYGVFSPEKLWCEPVQLQHRVPEKVPEGSGADG